MSEPRKPIPGSNSWAQESEKPRTAKTGPTGPNAPGPPTNRSKYEDTPPKPSTSKPSSSTSKPSSSTSKPSPSTSKPSSSSKPQAGPSRLPRIQPVTPLARPPQSRQNTKDRAVTDPIIPQPLAVTKKSLTERNQDEAVSQKEIFDEKISVQNDPPSLPRAGSDNGSEIYMAQPVTDNSRGELSSSAPPTTRNTPLFFSSAEERSARPPVQPYRLRQANWPTPTFSYSSLASNAHMSSTDNEMQGPDLGMIMGDGILNPTRTGAYARVGEVGIVHQDDAQRVSSQAGIIETVRFPGANNTPGYPSHLHGTLSQLEGRPPNSSARQSQQSTGSIQSESNYGGVWENHPHVGRSLPPYTSGSPRFPTNPNTASHHRSQSSRYTSGHNRTSSQLPPASTYSNSWMTDYRGNSFVSSNMAPIMSNPHPVPPPPSSYPGFQPSVQIPAAMEQMERNLHHHMDQCFASLTRLVTDKSDRITDQMVKEIESSDGKMDKAVKGVKGELREVKGEIRETKKEFASQHKETNEAMDSIREQVGKVDLAVKETGSKMDALDKKLDEVKEGDEENDSEREMRARPRYASTRRRTESAHRTLGHNERRPRRPSPSLSPTGLRQDGQGGQTGGSSRGRQVTAENGTGTGAMRRLSARARNRNYFARLGEMRGPPPDLSEHPAYRRDRERERASSSEHRVRQDPGRAAAGFPPNGSAEEGQPSARSQEGWFHRAYHQQQ